MYAERIKKLPPYLFIEIDKKKKALIDKGIDIISLGIGDPDLPTPEHIVKSCQDALTVNEYQKYPFGPGLVEFRNAVCAWYKERFNVSLNPITEVHSLIGSKEGIGHLPLAFVNPGDIVLIPDPGYPVYKSGTIFSGGEPYFMPLKEENGFLPDLEMIPEKVLSRTKLMFINYPNNPTASVADKKFFCLVVNLAKKFGFIVAHDAAYSEIFYDNQPPISFLSVPGAKDIGIEFHSLSKTYNMTGFRIGWACGNSEILKGLSIVKDNYDSGVFSAIQKCAITALTKSQECVGQARKTYEERRNLLVTGLQKLGWNVKLPKATFYVWAHCPEGYGSSQTVEKLLLESGIVATPGNGMGDSGEGYIRFALTVTKDRILEAIERIRRIKW